MHDEQKEHEKGADVDHDPQSGGDLRFGEEQQLLPGLARVGDERGGAPIGGSLLRIVDRKVANVGADPVAEPERARCLRVVPSLHRRPLVVDDPKVNADWYSGASSPVLLRCTTAASAAAAEIATQRIRTWTITV